MLQELPWLACAALSAALTFLSFPPFGLGWLLPVALIPVFVAIEKAPDWRRAAFRAWIYVFMGNSAICWWIAGTVHSFTSLPWGVSYLFVFILATTEQAAWPIVAGLRHWMHRKGIRPLLWTPAALMALDACWPKFFPNTLGNGLYRIRWICQVADVAGFWGLTALLIATNELGALLVLRAWPRRELRRHAAATLALVAAACAYGAWRYHQIHEVMDHPTGHLKAALIQPNIGSFDKVLSEHDWGSALDKVVSTLFILTERTLPQRPDLVVWPETSVPTDYHTGSKHEFAEATSLLDQYISKSNVPFLFGGYDGNDVERYNAIYLVTPGAKGLDIQRYHKSLLLVPSERIPLVDEIQSLRERLRAYGHLPFKPGAGATVLEHPRARLGMLICIEGLYPSFARELALKGSDVLVNVANDSWFGPGMEPELHLQLTAFRAIETRRPIVRATNTGHSAVIDIDGSLRTETSLDEAASVVADVPLYGPIRSPYLALGGAVTGLAAAWSLAWVLLAWRRRDRDVV